MNVSRLLLLAVISLTAACTSQPPASKSVQDVVTSEQRSAPSALNQPAPGAESELVEDLDQTEPELVDELEGGCTVAEEKCGDVGSQ